MKVQSYKTKIFEPPEDDLKETLNHLSHSLNNGDIVAITSKVVSICEGRTIKADQVKDKDELVKKQANRYLPREFVPGKWALHTITRNILIPTAGVDESNGNGYYILWPEDPEASAKKIWQHLTKKAGIKNLGVVITDSHSIPLRRGLVGISLAHWGFEPLKDYRGKKDLFGKKLEVSLANIPDALAAAAVLAMGEGSEQTPI